MTVEKPNVFYVLIIDRGDHMTPGQEQFSHIYSKGLALVALLH